MKLLLSRELSGRGERDEVLKRCQRIKICLDQCSSQVLLGFLPYGDRLVGYSFIQHKLVVEFWEIDPFRERFIPVANVPVCEFAHRLHLPLQIIVANNEQLCIVSAHTLYSTKVVSVVCVLDEHHALYPSTFVLQCGLCDFPQTQFHMHNSSKLSACAFDFGTHLEVLYLMNERTALRCNNEWWKRAAETCRVQTTNSNPLVQILELDGEAYLFDELQTQLDRSLSQFAVLDFTLQFARFLLPETDNCCTFEFIVVAKVRLVEERTNIFVGLVGHISPQAYCLMEVFQSPAKPSNNSSRTRCMALVERRRKAHHPPCATLLTNDTVLAGGISLPQMTSSSLPVEIIL